MSAIWSMTHQPRNELIARALAVESLLVETWRECCGKDEAIALVAVGGFGRAELFLHSDVDLLILLDAKKSKALAPQISHFQALAWQLKCAGQALDLALSVRTIDETLRFAGEDLNFFTSLLDTRLLTGAGDLLESLQQKLWHKKLWAAKDFFAAKLQEQTQRHLKFADTAYNNEPNLKEGPGGLRDLHTLRWVAQRHLGHRLLPFGWHVLADNAMISGAEAEELCECERLLSLFRQALHQRVGRKEERLLFDHQINLATDFGLHDQGFSNRAVEQLMQVYFRTARRVIRLNAMLLARFAQRYFSDGDNRIKALDADFYLSQGLLDCHPSLTGLSVDGALLALARFQQQAEAKAMGAHFLQALNTVTLEANVPDTQAPSWAPHFLALLNAPRRVAAALTVAADHGLLGKLLPAFERVTGRMQYDLFHAYTVDQHTLFVLKKLENLRISDPEFQLANEVWTRIRHPHVMFLAALFHDLAKGRGGDHSELGAVDAKEWTRALGLPENQSDLIAWLVAQHLTMSTTAQKRDIQDPGVVRDFVDLVADRERLDHLYLLTVADIRGTNPKLWNGWKARLLEDLYRAARFELRRGSENPVNAAERIETAKSEALQLLQGEIAGRAPVLQVWQDFPENSFLRYSTEELRFQTQAVLAAKRAEANQVIVMRPIAGKGAFELFVRIPDRSGIFATITAVLDRLQMSVLGARIGMTPSGYTHDSFQLFDLRPELDAPRERALEVQMQLRLALEARTLTPKIAKRMATRQQKHFQFPAQIEFSAPLDGTHHHSVLALTCPDSFGLLAKVALCLFEQNLRVLGARIATFGERVEDFFLISNTQGLALSDAEQNELRAALMIKLGTS